MTSNIQSERSDAPAISSKTSLLWAYQLRREHVHLVDRIDDMNTQLISYTNQSQTCEQNVSNLESLVKTLQAENYTLKNEVTLVRTKLTARIEDINQQITRIVSGDNAVKDATRQLELDFRGMGVQVLELSKCVSELKGKIANATNQKGDHGAQEVDVGPMQDNTDLAKVESGSEQIQTRPKRVITLSLGKKRGLYPVCIKIYIHHDG
jgi:chromosome segregation ATPase